MSEVHPEKPQEAWFEKCQRFMDWAIEKDGIYKIVDRLFRLLEWMGVVALLSVASNKTGNKDLIFASDGLVQLIMFSLGAVASIPLWRWINANGSRMTSGRLTVLCLATLAVCAVAAVAGWEIRRLIQALFEAGLR